MYQSNDHKVLLTLPTAHITTKKSRLKLHNSNPKNVYLNDGDNFQFELFNPTKNVVLAKISLDGKLISNMGLVLNPGQRVFLDRFINEAKKFKFSTYEVSGKSEEVKEAISDNGKVTVSFYDEYIPINWNFGTISTGSIFYGGTNITTGGNAFFPTNTTYTSTVILDSLASSTYTSSTTPSSGILRGVKSLKPIETGRVEKGENSKQNFNTVNKNFNTTAFHTVEYKILPLSQIEIKDVKSYCGNCSKVTKPNWKFCTSCGFKLE